MENETSKDVPKGNITNDMLLEYLVNFKKDINIGNENLGKKINDKIERIDEKMDKNINSINDKIERIGMDVGKINDAVTENKEEIKGINDRMDNEWRDNYEKITKRINNIKKEMKNSLDIRKRTTILRQQEKTLQNQQQEKNTKKQTTNEDTEPAVQTISYSSNWALQLEAAQNTYEKGTNDDNDDPIPSSWMDRQDNADNNIEHDWFNGDKPNDESRERMGTKPNDKADTMEVKDTTEVKDKRQPGPAKTKGMKKLKSWFGDESTEEEISEDDSIDEDNNDWEKVNRIKKNKEKKKQRKVATEKKMAETIEKANHIIGLGPITDLDLEKSKAGGKFLKIPK